MAARPVKFLPAVHQITAPTASLAVTIPGGAAPEPDDLVWVFLDGHQLMEGQDYTRTADGQSITFTSPIQPAPDGAPAREVAVLSQKQTVVGSGQQPGDILQSTVQSIGKPGGLATLDENGRPAQMPTAQEVGALAADAVQSGSGESGSWAKLPDGTMLCWGALSVTLAAAEATYMTWAVPMQFIGLYHAVATAVYGSNQVYVQCQVASRGTEAMTLAVKNPGTGQISTSICVLALGRWK